MRITTKDHAEDAKQFIDNNFSQIKRIEDVAMGLGVTYDRLRKDFPRMFGMPMNAYLNKVRIVEAKRLVVCNMKLYAIARAVGYSSEVLLIRHWKKLVGNTPKDFKNACSNISPE